MKNLKMFEDNLEDSWGLIEMALEVESEKLEPFAEEGIAHDELILLSKSKEKIQSIDPDAWTPELITRIHNILKYLIIMKMLKDFNKVKWTMSIDTMQEIMSGRSGRDFVKLYWKINESKHTVDVQFLKNGNKKAQFILVDGNPMEIVYPIDADHCEFSYPEVINQIGHQKMKQFDL